MKRLMLAFSLLAFALAGGQAAHAQDTQTDDSTQGAQQTALPELDRGETVEKLGFPAVVEKLSGWTKFGKGKVYTLPLKKGQRVRVTFNSKSKYAYMAIFNLSSNDDESFFGTDEDGMTADVTVNEDTTWLIKPYYSRVTRRRGRGAPYEILIDPNPPATQQPAGQDQNQPANQAPSLFPPKAKQGQ
ncbi:hypothetical protein [Rhizobium mayense]|uniref:Uncharacterized protein n=1 Tax=Rhizobium mayense TaxID=1312184 RepID=A0ABT7K2F0_9HYPH|nr:hypothetical protein [Rhizobium mayense]MDL2402779.1 hypothetical protein [Rhizobium mayense]